MLSMVWHLKRDCKAEKKMSTCYISACGVQGLLFLDIFKPIKEMMQLDRKVIDANVIISKLVDQLV